MTTELTPCACGHCQCSFILSEGFSHEGQTYCSPACATHDHEHPSPCCQSNTCC